MDKFLAHLDESILHKWCNGLHLRFHATDPKASIVDKLMLELFMKRKDREENKNEIIPFIDLKSINNQMATLQKQIQKLQQMKEELNEWKKSFVSETTQFHSHFELLRLSLQTISQEKVKEISQKSTTEKTFLESRDVHYNQIITELTAEVEISNYVLGVQKSELDQVKSELNESKRLLQQLEDRNRKLEIKMKNMESGISTLFTYSKSDMDTLPSQLIGQDLCRICQDRQINALVGPCGHVVMCLEVKLKVFANYSNLFLVRKHSTILPCL
jgi:hypothetical protein